MIIFLDDNGSVEDFDKSVDVLKAMFLIRRALFLLTPQTIKNCFRKAGVQRASHIESDEIEEITPTIVESLHVPEIFRQRILKV